ncbi:MAG: hypothetical protein JWM59_5061 [Verrucomicrobiales bacterium]|nr:hypothetical protein [Verrucomicrobiales bacterium]
MKDDLNPYAPPVAELEQENPDWLVTQPLAGNGKRFLNHLIDLGICSFVLLPVIDPYLPESGNFFVNLGYTYLLNVVYHSANELCGGRGISKLITGTQAQMKDGAPLTFKGAVLRSLCRLIPFEQFSFLGSSRGGWHDTMAGTRVIDLRGKPVRTRKHASGVSRILPPGVILPGTGTRPAAPPPPDQASPSPLTEGSA